MGLPGAVRSRLARHQGALRADGARGRLDGLPAAGADARLHLRVLALAKVTIPGIPYPVFALAGLTLWIFVSRGVLTGSESLLANIALVTKTACPRILIPLAAVVSIFVDFLVALALFFVISAVYGFFPTWRVVFVPPLLFVAFVLTFGLSLFLSATNVRYRDVAQALPFMVMLWFFLSPVAYELQTPGHSWETLIQAVNPLVGLLLAFRWALLDTPPPHGLLVHLGRDLAGHLLLRAAALLPRRTYARR